MRLVEAFLDARHVAERAARREPRQVGRHPFRDQPIRFDLQVRVDFVVEIIFGATCHDDICGDGDVLF